MRRVCVNQLFRFCYCKEKAKGESDGKENVKGCAGLARRRAHRLQLTAAAPPCSSERLLLLLLPPPRHWRCCWRTPRRPPPVARTVHTPQCTRHSERSAPMQWRVRAPRDGPFAEFYLCFWSQALHIRSSPGRILRWIVPAVSLLPGVFSFTRMCPSGARTSKLAAADVDARYQ